MLRGKPFNHIQGLRCCLIHFAVSFIQRFSGEDIYYLLTTYYLDEDYGEKMMKKKMKKRCQEVL